MNKLNITLNKKEKYILACSYGPDSMALFDLLLKNKYKFVVAHVNYHILTYADEDEKQLRKYCEKHKIPIYVLDKPYTHNMGNEEDVCREIRYNFFKNLAKTTQIKNILIAHNLDDHIETYLLQQERGNYVSHYGLASSYNSKDVTFVRPLLNYRKETLLEYCDKNKIPYSIDYSNYDYKFRRNYLRHQIVNKMSEDEIKTCLKTIDQLNEDKAKIISEISKFIEDIFIDYKKVKNLNIEEKQCLIYSYMDKYSLFETVSKGFIEDFFNQCKHHKGTFSLKLNETIFECSYGNIIIYKDKKINYELKLENGTLEENEIFKINKNSPVFREISLQNSYILKNIWPNHIDKKYKVHNFSKKISRCFIDWKMPLCLRKIWPGIFDNSGSLVYVPRYRKDFKITDKSFLIFSSTILIKDKILL